MRSLKLAFAEVSKLQGERIRSPSEQRSQDI